MTDCREYEYKGWPVPLECGAILLKIPKGFECGHLTVTIWNEELRRDLGPRIRGVIDKYLPGNVWLVEDPENPWRTSEENTTWMEIPDAVKAGDEILALIQSVMDSVPENSEEAWKQALHGVPEGQRNYSMTSLAGKIFSELSPDLWETVGWAGLLEANRNNKPPLDHRELRRVFDSIAEREWTQRELKAQRLPVAREPEVYTAASLQNVNLPEPEFIVQGLLPEGLTVLAGKPKKGKSWLALKVALAVANGEPLWGRESLATLASIGSFGTMRGSVLYLALEDGKRRIRSRLRTLLVGGSEPGDLYFAHNWPGLHDGGLERLNLWLREHPETRLVVVDTLARVRRAQRGRRGDLYQEGYADGAGLQTLAQTYHIALLVVHHTRKADSDDPQDLVSGTRGLPGAADTVWVLKRPAGKAEADLYLISRDIAERELALRLDSETMSWELLGEAEAYRQSESRQEVVGLLKSEGTLHYRRIAATLGKSPESVRRLLWRMVRDGQICDLDKGEFKLHS